MKHRVEIDGLRALAILPVVGFHMGFSFLPAGFLGVDVFFVISGFLIGGILFRELETTGRISLHKFYERRIRRIFPGFLTMVVVTFIASWLLLLPNDFKSFESSIWYAITSTSNIFFNNTFDYFSQDVTLVPLVHTWSLSVEEQFYIFFPLVLLAIKFVPGRSKYYWLFGLLAIGSLVCANLEVVVNPTSAFYLVQFRGWELLVGVLAAIYLSTRQALPKFAEPLSLVGLLLLLIPYFAYPTDFLHPSIMTFWPVLGAALVLVFAQSGTLVARMLSFKPMVWIGLISYSLYLWHQPVFALVRIWYGEAISTLDLLPWLAVSVVVSYISWRFVEQVFRDRKSMSVKSLLSAVSAGVLATLVTVSLVAEPASANTKFPVGGGKTVTAFELDSRMSPNYGVNRVCSNFLKHQSTCTSGTATANPTVALWGDSFSMHIVQALQQSRTKAKFVSQSLITCNPIEGIAPKNKANGMSGAKNCNKVNSAFMAYLMSSKAKSSIRTVILASHWENILLNGKTTLDSRQVLSQDSQKPRAALQATISKLRNAGYRVVVISSPAYTETNSGQCLRTAILKRKSLATCDFPLSANQSNTPNTLLRSIVTGANKYINLVDMMCPHSVCKASVNGTIMFRDRYHLAREGSAYLGRTYDLMGQALN